LFALLASERQTSTTVRLSSRVRFVGESAQMFDDAGIHALEQRQHLGSYPHPGVLRVSIRGITRERKLVTREVNQNVGAPRTKERSHQIAVACRKHTKSIEATPTQHSEQHRLRPIVGVVSRCDECPSEFGGAPPQLRVPHLSGSRLYVPTWSDQDGSTRERHAETRRQLLRQIELTAGFWTKAVIDPVREQRQASGFSEPSHHV
jgi:hypothetical protein